MRDYEKLVKGLRYCFEHDDCGSRCPYFSQTTVCADERAKEAADAIEELLKEKARLENSGKLLVAAFERLKEKVPKWISVEERLPEDQGDDARAARGGDYIHKVLAASVTPNYTVMDTAYLENGIWSLSKYTSWKQIIGAPVTHWMPLPDPPKED